MTPTWKTKAWCDGECEKCGRRFGTPNGMGLAAQHFARCGGRIRVEVTRTYLWEPDGLNPRQREALAEVAS